MKETGSNLIWSLLSSHRRHSLHKSTSDAVQRSPVAADSPSFSTIPETKAQESVSNTNLNSEEAPKTTSIKEASTPPEPATKIPIVVTSADVSSAPNESNGTVSPNGNTVTGMSLETYLSGNAEYRKSVMMSKTQLLKEQEKEAIEYREGKRKVIDSMEGTQQKKIDSPKRAKNLQIWKNAEHARIAYLQAKQEDAGKMSSRRSPKKRQGGALKKNRSANETVKRLKLRKTKKQHSAEKKKQVYN